MININIPSLLLYYNIWNTKTKRLTPSFSIRKDDNVNFKKYEYQASAYVFGRSVGYRSGVSLCELNKKTWLEIINSGAKKYSNFVVMNW